MQLCSLCKEVKKCINNKNFGLICRQCYLKFVRPKKQCEICGNERPVGKNINCKPVCLSCYSKYFRVKRICNNCGNERFIVKNIDGKSICSACYKKSYRPKKICSICGNEGIVEKSIVGKPICRLCYERFYRPKKICSQCGNEHTITKNIDGKCICNSCYQKYFRPKKICNICGCEAIIAKKQEDKNICLSCYDKFYRPKRLCQLCNKEGKTYKIIEGKSICPSCYSKNYKPKRICNICGKEGKVAKKIEDKSFCPSCYKKYYQNQEVCINCGKLNIVALRINNLPICSTCYHKFYKKKFICSNCNNLIISAKVIDEEHICPKCYNKLLRSKKICHICGNEAIVSKLIDNRPVCPSCYSEYFQPKRICDLCGQEDIICLILNGKNICHSCYHKTKGICENCGGTAKGHYAFRGMCKDCWYTQKLQAFIVSSKNLFTNNYIYDLFCRYAEIVIKHRKPISAYLNITNFTDLFLFIDKDNINCDDISFEYIYKLADNFHYMTIQQFQNFLIRENILNPIDPLSVFDKVRFKYINKLTGSFSDSLLKYTNYLISICKKYKTRGWENRLSIVTCMNYSYTTFRFLSFISEKLESIHELTNHQIDDFLAKTLYTYGHLRQFVKWLNNNVSLFSKLKLPHSHENGFNIDTYNEDEMILIFESLFMDQTLYKDQMVCLLLILYAVRPSEISKLTLNDFVYTSTDSRLYVRNKWIILNPIIGSIINNYIQTERSNLYSFGSKIDWIIPGKIYDKPISTDCIYTILEKYNISSRKAFRTAIMNQYMDNIYSPSLLVHGLGINFKTAISYFDKFTIDNCKEIIDRYTYDNKEINYVYILKCNDGSYYTGYTSNLQKRLQQHQTGKGCTYTKTRTPVELVYTEELPDKPSALKREKQIKKLTIFDKEKLIEKSRVN